MVNMKQGNFITDETLASNYNNVNNKNWFKVTFPIIMLLFMYFTLFIGIIFYFMIRIENIDKEMIVYKNTIQEIKYSLQRMGLDLKPNEEYYPDLDPPLDFLPDYAIEDPITLQDGKIPTDYLDEDTTEIYEKIRNNKEIIRSKREVVGVTDDGVPVNSESYAEIKRKNSTRNWIRLYERLSVPPSSTIGPSYDEDFIKHILHKPASTPTESTIVPEPTSTTTTIPKPTVFNRQFRVMYPDDKSNEFRQVLKQNFFKSADPYIRANENRQGQDFNEDSIHMSTNRNQPMISSSNSKGYLETFTENGDTLPSRMGRHRPLITTHFSGDTSKFVVGQHSRFNGIGNGHIRHLQKTFVDWKQSNWVNIHGMGTHFSYNQGTVTIKEPGIYFIYAQIYYLDVHDLNGFRVYKNEESIVLQCTITSSSTERVLKGNTCYTAGAEFLEEGDKVTVADIADGRYTLFEPGKSFFGLVKLGDARK